jgi:CheY-like chemotaxis protein
MSAKILIVEDEFLVAMNLERVIEDLGHSAIGIAPDQESALDLADEQPDVALVDLNLRDGLTGPQIGKMLSELGITVIYVTANPRILGDGVPGTLGVMPKPCDGRTIAGALDYALMRRRGLEVMPPPYMIAFNEKRA